MKVTANARRSGGWWAVDVPEVEGAFTQAKRLDQVPAMVADAVALLAGVPADTVEVDVHPVIDAAVEKEIRLAREGRAEARRADAESAQRIRRAARALHEQGLPLRDIGTVLDVSYQRAHQLVS